MVMGRGTVEPLCGAKVVMLGQMHVSGEADRMRSRSEQPQERSPIDGVVGGAGGVQIIQKRNVHR
jgi:hypothetical protein